MDYINQLKENKEFNFWLGGNDQEINFIEKELNIKIPTEYRIFLSECGMCNYGDFNILGIAKAEYNISYPVIEVTKELRIDVSLPTDFIVISYEIGEYVTLYKISCNERIDDSQIYGANIKYDSFGKNVIGDISIINSSFVEFFIDFIELGK